MSEKRIKGTFISKHREDVDSYHWVIEVPAADFNVANFGTAVEIVYRDEVEIRPGQKWKIEGEPEDEQHLAMVIKGEQAWYLASMTGHMLSHLGIDKASKSNLQGWLNEHATLAEGES